MNHIDEQQILRWVLDIRAVCLNIIKETKSANKNIFRFFLIFFLNHL